MKDVHKKKKHYLQCLKINILHSIIRICNVIVNLQFIGTYCTYYITRSLEKYDYHKSIRYLYKTLTSIIYIVSFNKLFKHEWTFVSKMLKLQLDGRKLYNLTYVENVTKEANCIIAYIYYIVICRYKIQVCIYRYLYILGTREYIICNLNNYWLILCGCLILYTKS